MASRDKIIAKAEKLVSKGKIEAAIGEYEKVLKESPNDVNTLNRVGDLWVRAKKPEEAVKVFGQIADHYSRDGFFLKSIAIYKKINKLDPANLDIYEKLAELYAKQGLAMEAKSQYTILADNQLKSGNNKLALETYRKIAELDPNSIQTHVKLADLYKAAGETEAALAQYDKVGGMLLRKGMTDEAVQVYEKALKIDSSNLDLIASLTSALTEAGQPDKALGILETARDENPDDGRLATVYGKALIESGDTAKAKSVLEEAVAMSPDDHAARESLGDLYLAEGDASKAFEILDKSIQARAGEGEVAAAVATANQILDKDPHNVEVLGRVVEVYEQANQETNIVTSLNALAEAHMALGDNDAAASVLDRILEREPANEQIRQKLEMVRGGEPAPAAQEGPAVEEAVAIDLDDGSELDLDASAELDLESVSEISLDDEAELDLDDSPALEIDQIPEIALDDAEAIDLDDSPAADLEMPAPEPEGDAADDEQVTFIAEHMTEAEVFSKYGLVDRAVEHLEQVIEKVPDHLPAHEALFNVYLEDGAKEKAGAAATNYLARLREAGDDAGVQKLEELAAEHGIAVGETAAVAAVAGEPAEAPPEIDEEPSVEIDLDFGDEEELPVEVEEEPAEVSLEFEDEPAEEVAVEIEDETPVGVEAVAEADSDELDLDGIDFDDVSFEDSEEEVAVSTDGEPVVSLGDEPELSVVDSPTPPLDQTELSEIDFYLSEQLFDEARDKVAELQARHPNAPELATKLAQIEEAETEAAAAAGSVAAEEEKPAALDIESELSMLLPDDDAGEPAAAQKEEPVAAAAPAPAVEEEGLFDDEDDFFDLAAELEEELGDDLGEDFTLAEEEQSLEDVFKEFKKGVEEQLDSEDYETHYNLGIAYKEMGLIDEAIGEFQIASKDPGRAVECCSMLGLCFLEKGMPQLAVKWYQKGLELPELSEEEHLGLLYELGNAYEQIGDPANAHKTFVEVYGIKSNYRDVADRIKQLDSVT